MLRIGVLCSGGLGLDTLIKLADYCPIEFILTDKKSAGIISFAKQHKTPCFKGNPRDGRGHDFIKNLKVDVIASINYLFLIEKDIIDHPDILAFNIHGSLLPKYRGRTPHVWAIINGETVAGITAHLINSGCDSGDIIYQIKVPIFKEDTGADMLKKYSKEYFPLAKKILQNIESNRLNFTPQNESEVTYFGKRTPDDGEINWNWKKERIRNWVRAQSYPYPGAFTFLGDEKIIVDKVSHSDFDILESQINGEVISVDPYVIVKVKDGALKLDEIRTENSTFVVGNLLCNENRT
ncbi:methionyl-tRNA formyltransferase [Winogradskyella flava]|uniref:methionyl-tRNA formyltransferase n=1 Tax=Winogradskyella flava TaxID=1884876 RepID=UPI0024921F3C|nr:formyltransferase family protein [Winogradskyella flava]